MKERIVWLPFATNMSMQYIAAATVIGTRIGKKKTGRKHTQTHERKTQTRTHSGFIWIYTS